LSFGGQQEAGVGYQSRIFFSDILAMPIDKNIIMLARLVTIVPKRRAHKE
jgi:hypothetical protein